MKRLFITITLLSLLLIPTGIILAAPLDTIVGESETVNNDIAVFGEDLVIKAGAVVDGDVIVFGGDADIMGTITGDLAVFGGDVHIASKIDGDVVLFGGDLEAVNGATVRGDCVLLGGDLDSRGESGLGCTSAGRVNLDLPEFGAADFRPSESFGRSFVGHLMAAIGGGLFAALLALIVATAFPQQMRQVEQTIRAQPAASGVVGALTAVAVPAIIGLLVPISILLLFVCIGILGFPVMLALGVGLIAASVFGWVTMGQVVGQRITEMLNMRKLSLPLTTALGAAAMTFGIGLLGAFSLGFFEGLLRIVVASVGLGAVALTQFGRKPYPYLARQPQHVVESDQADDEFDVAIDDDKLTAVLDTLPDEDNGPLS